MESFRGNLREIFEIMDTIYSIDDMGNGVMVNSENGQVLVKLIDPSVLRQVKRGGHAYDLYIWRIP